MATDVTREAQATYVSRSRSCSTSSDEPESYYRSNLVETWHYVLAPESPNVRAVLDDEESVWSIQDKSTDIVSDTSDISSEWASANHPSPVKEDDDATNDDASLMCTPVSSNLRCLQCNKETSYPWFRYCQDCYKTRKTTLPPRPHKRGASTLSLCSTDEQTKEEGETCGTCLVRPKNGGFIHNNSVHVYTCYPCAVKIYNKCGRCPICNERASQVKKISIDN